MSLPANLYWRVHPPERPFDPEDATSTTFHTEDTRPGYSCFANPWHLFLYLDANNLYQQATQQEIIGFTGTRVGTGADGEDLVLPDLRTVRRFSMAEWEAQLATTPLPDSPKFSEVWTGRNNDYLSWAKTKAMFESPEYGWTLGSDPVIDVILKAAAYVERPMAQPPYYHGSNVALAPGETIEPARLTGTQSRFEDHDFYDPTKVYLTSQPHLAARYAFNAAKHGGGEPHVYEARPIGPVYADPEYTESGFGSDQVVTLLAEVVRELPFAEVAEQRYLKTAENDYRGQHAPPSDGPPLHDLLAGHLFPDDVYDHPEHYAFGDYAAASAKLVLKVRNKPDAMVTIYRAVPPNVGATTINTGDWVSIVKGYARDHGRGRTWDEWVEPKDPNWKQDPSVITNKEGWQTRRGNWTLLEATVPASQIRSGGNDIVEWGYFGPPITSKTSSVQPRPLQAAADLTDRAPGDSEPQSQSGGGVGAATDDAHIVLGQDGVRTGFSSGVAPLAHHVGAVASMGIEEEVIRATAGRPVAGVADQQARSSGADPQLVGQHMGSDGSALDGELPVTTALGSSGEDPASVWSWLDVQEGPQSFLGSAEDGGSTRHGAHGTTNGGDWGPSKTAAWRDVRNKAREIRSGGGVRVIAATGDTVTAEVKSTTGSVYQTSLLREPGTHNVAMWECTCAWSAYSWGRSGRWRKYEGRMCAHALALVYEAQAQEWGGGNITEGEGHGEEITFYEAPPIEEWRVDVPRPGGDDLGRAASKTAYREISRGDLTSPGPFFITLCVPLTFSGWKAHVYCESVDDVMSVYHRIKTELIAHDDETGELAHELGGWGAKVATQTFFDRIGRDNKQWGKGVTVYFPKRAEVQGDIDYLVQLMQGWKTGQIEGDEMRGNGVGVRFEFSYDPGEDVDIDTYNQLYKAAAKDPRFQGVTLDEDDDGFYVRTHRARSDSYSGPEHIPQSVVDFIESTGSKTATRGLPFADMWESTSIVFSIVADPPPGAGSFSSSFPGQLPMAQRKMTFQETSDWSGFLNRLTLEAKDSQVVRDRGDGLQTFYLCADGRGPYGNGDQWVVGETDYEGFWRAEPWSLPTHKLRGGYSRDWEVNTQFLNHAYYDSPEAFRKYLAEEIAGVNIDDSMFAGVSNTEPTVVYRGIALPVGMDPLNSTTDRHEGVGHSWTLDFEAACRMAERNGAGFHSDNRTVDGYLFNAVRGDDYVPTVLRATVIIDGTTIDTYRPWTIDYASEQEVDIPEGTQITIDGYMQARPVVVSPAQYERAKQTEDRYGPEGYYLVRFEWPSYFTGANRKTVAMRTTAARNNAFGMTIDAISGVPYLNGKPVFIYPSWDPYVGIADFIAENGELGDFTASYRATAKQVTAGLFPIEEDWVTEAESGTSNWHNGIYSGVLDADAVGYRAMGDIEELRSAFARGSWQSEKRFTLGFEGATHFTSDPNEVINFNGAKVIVEVDLHGLPFKVIQPPVEQGGQWYVNGDRGEGLGVEGDIPARRILRVGVIKSGTIEWYEPYDFLDPDGPGWAHFAGKKISLKDRIKTAQIEASDPMAGLRDVLEAIDSKELTHSGLIIKAIDSGRVLMTQRTPYAEDPDGVYGRWEFPGGGIGEDEDAFTSALREFREETGLELPEDWAVEGQYTNGKYMAIILLVPHEGWTTNATLLSHEVMGVGWFHPDQIDGSDIAREEVDKTEWDLVREAAAKKGDGVNTCKFCGSESLWDNFFDKDGYGVNDDSNGATWDTLCNDCGKFQNRRNKKTAKTYTGYHWTKSANVADIRANGLRRPAQDPGAPERTDVVWFSDTPDRIDYAAWQRDADRHQYSLVTCRIPADASWAIGGPMEGYPEPDVSFALDQAIPASWIVSIQSYDEYIASGGRVVATLHDGSLHVTPEFAVDDGGDMRLSQTHGSTDGTLGFTGSVTHPDLSDDVWGESGVGVGHPDVGWGDPSPVSISVGGVLLVGPQQPMSRVLAGSEVAGVSDQQGAGVTNGPGVPPTVGGNHARAAIGTVGAIPEAAVLDGTSGQTPRPGPAGVNASRGVDLGEVPGFGAEFTWRHILQSIQNQSMLHDPDEPEPALPSTDGSAEEVEDLFSPDAIAQREAALGGDDSDIAAAANAYLAKTAVKVFSPKEQMDLIEEGAVEGVTAANLDRLDIEGTHYEALEERYRYLDASEDAAQDLFL